MSGAGFCHYCQKPTSECVCEYVDDLPGISKVTTKFYYALWLKGCKIPMMFFYEKDHALGYAASNAYFFKDGTYYFTREQVTYSVPVVKEETEDTK